jgi:serine/threonine protein kinase
METLKEIIPGIKYIKTNIDGSKKSYGNLNLLDLYNIAEPKIGEICSKYNITNFELPKISGYNSLVIYADNNQSKFAIKIFVISKNDIENFDTIYKLISDNNISPKIYYDENTHYNSKKYIVKITVTDRLILFSEFKWESLDKMKNSIMTLIEKTVKLHSLGYVHNDIKYENLGLDEDGNMYLFDFDNFSEISTTSCVKTLSSYVCHPPDILVQASISIGLGNQIIDLFSICAIILGDIIGIIFWAFDNKQFYEKNQQLSNFKRNRIHDTINKKIYSKFKETCLSKFWFSLVNFFHLVFQKNNQIKNKRAFIRRAKKLIRRMKDDMKK